MTQILLDTSYLIAHFNERDEHHSRALEVQDAFMEGAWQDLLVVDWVFAELCTVLMKRRGYAVTKQVGEALRRSEEIQWVAAAPHFEAAWHEFLAQPAGRLSLVDCALVAVADRLNVADIATFDEGFDGIPRIRRVPGPAAGAKTG